MRIRNRKTLRFTFSLALLTFFPPASALPINTITTVSAMRSTSGQVIKGAQQPHIAKFGEKWYAGGFDFQETHGYNGSCYSSKDLKTWTNEPICDCWGGFVLYNSKNKEYVCIGAVYGVKAVVYTGPGPTGPFTFHNDMTNTAGGVGDNTVFSDTDGKAYLIYNKYQGSIPQRFAYIYQLNDDYYDIIPSTFSDTKTVMEGFWMVKHKSNYFLFGSGLVGCGVDDNFYITAPTPLGPWTYRGNFVPTGSNTFESQTFQGLQVTGSKGTANIFIGQRANCTGNGRSIWLPLVFNSDTTVQTMQWVDQWTLDTAGSIGFKPDSTISVNWVDDKAASVKFNGTWFSEPYAACYAGSEKYSKTAGDYVEFGFRGNSVSWIGTSYPNRGMADIYIDGVLDISNVDLYWGSLRFQDVQYQKTWAVQDTHTVKIVVDGTKNTYSTDSYLSVDAFVYHTEVGQTSVVLPANRQTSETELLSVDPNPFTSACQISFSLKQSFGASLSVYNMSGNLIKRFAIGAMKTGPQTIVWDGTGLAGKPISEGVYICRLYDGKKVMTKRIVFSK